MKSRKIVNTHKNLESKGNKVFQVCTNFCCTQTYTAHHHYLLSWNLLTFHKFLMYQYVSRLLTVLRSLLRIVRTAKIMTAKCPNGEVSLLQSVHTAKCPYGEVTVRWKFLRPKVREPGKIHWPNNAIAPLHDKIGLKTIKKSKYVGYCAQVEKNACYFSYSHYRT